MPERTALAAVLPRALMASLLGGTLLATDSAAANTWHTAFVADKDTISGIFDRVRVSQGQLMTLLSEQGTGERLKGVRVGDVLELSLTSDRTLQGLRLHARVGSQTMTLRRSADGSWSRSLGATPPAVRASLEVRWLETRLAAARANRGTQRLAGIVTAPAVAAPRPDSARPDNSGGRAAEPIPAGTQDVAKAVTADRAVAATDALGDGPSGAPLAGRTAPHPTAKPPAGWAAAARAVLERSELSVAPLEATSATVSAAPRSRQAEALAAVSRALLRVTPLEALPPGTGVPSDHVSLTFGPGSGTAGGASVATHVAGKDTAGADAGPADLTGVAALVAKAEAEIHGRVAATRQSIPALAAATTRSQPAAAATASASAGASIARLVRTAEARVHRTRSAATLAATRTPARVPKRRLVRRSKSATQETQLASLVLNAERRVQPRRSRSKQRRVRHLELPRGADPRIAKVLAGARQHLGVPYVWGGTSPEGFDCSGLVYYHFTRVGVRIPRTAATLYAHTKSKPVPMEKLAPGDLVFFRDRERPKHIGHVGIYIGKDRFIHAVGENKPVQITKLSKPFYARRFVRGGRLVG